MIGAMEQVMNRALVPTLLFMLVACAAGGPSTQPDDAEAKQTSGSEQEIRALEARLNKAIIRADRELFDRVFAEDFTHTNHSGVFRTKAQWMANHKPDAKSPYESFDSDDLAVRVYGDTAVVTGRSTPRGKTAAGEPITGQFRFLRVWVKRQGQWKAVAFQGTRITP
jgi:uncharacterized protein (TIGR02246 family)